MDAEKEHILDQRDDKKSKQAINRSICYHESGHTAFSYITRRHVAQIVDPRLGIVGLKGFSFINPLSQLVCGKLSKDEKIFFHLIWFSVQALVEENKNFKVWEDMIISHWYGWRQSDISETIEIVKKQHENMSLWEQKRYINFAIKKIKDFLNNEPKLKKFIARLSYLNQKQNLLLPEHIEEAAKYAWIDTDERTRLRAEIRKLNLLK